MVDEALATCCARVRRKAASASAADELHGFDPRNGRLWTQYGPWQLLHGGCVVVPNLVRNDQGDHLDKAKLWSITWMIR
jgi:hypothetical protein